jgi:glycosyltransferase involved in cell wall biosynthesis
MAEHPSSSRPQVSDAAAEPRVLQVLQPDDGGVAEHVLHLAEGLPARGWGVEVAASEHSEIRGRLRELGVTVHSLPLNREIGMADVRAHRELRRLDRARRYSVVHAHSSKAGALVRLALAGRRRLVYTPHCFAFDAELPFWKRLSYRAIEQALVPRTGALVTVCEWERSSAQVHLGGVKSRLRLIPNGVAECVESTPARPLVEFAAGQPLIGFIGVLRPQKNLLNLVRAAALLRERGRAAVRVAIVGNGSQASEVEAEIGRLGLGEMVRRFPFEESVGAYLAALDLFVLPSAWEALPISVLEAMICGVPVVATTVGGVPEIVEDRVTGRLVEPHRPDQMAAAIDEMLAEPKALEGMATAGRARAAERFSLDEMVAKIAAMYEELIAGSPRGDQP